MTAMAASLTAGPNMSLCGPSASTSFNESFTEQMRAIRELKHYTYGVAMPVICALGIVGNLLNLLVLTRKNMKSVAYCYMRGYAASSLVALLLAVPFCLRILVHGEARSWTHYGAALYFARLELYLGNGFIGLSVLMLVALTTERYISVCHPVRAHNQTNEGRRARITLAVLPVCTFIIFSPYTLRTSVIACASGNGSVSYRIVENLAFTQSTYYLVYKWTLKILYKIAPTVAITYLNLQIYWSYRRVCRKRRSLVHMSREQRAQQTDEHRLMMLLGSTATLFFFCNLPMVVLSVSFSQAMIWSYPFQVFRAVCNVLEIVNYSMTFYIYCLFTKEFRDTFFKTIGLREHSSVMVPSKSSKTDV